METFKKMTLEKLVSRFRGPALAGTLSLLSCGGVETQSPPKEAEGGSLSVQELLDHRKELTNKQVVVNGYAAPQEYSCAESFPPQCNAYLVLAERFELGQETSNDYYPNILSTIQRIRLRGNPEDIRNPYGQFNKQTLACSAADHKEGYTCNILKVGKRYDVTGTLKKETGEKSDTYLQMEGFEETQ